MEIIDPHVHFFDLQAGDYLWLRVENPPHWHDKQRICQNFSEQHLTLKAPLTLKAFVHIEAGFDNRQPWREIDWLTRHCRLPFKAIGCVDLEAPDFEQSLKQLQQYPEVVGVRHILDQQAARLLCQQQVRDNLALLSKQQLIFESQLMLADTQAVNLLAELARQYPALSLVINHGGLPPATSDEFDQWQHNLVTLSQLPNCSIKCSGWEMIERNYSEQWLAKICLAVLSAFGPERVMLASNFPVCLLSTSYNALWQSYQQLPLDEALLQKLCYDNAWKIYRFTP
jgi:predicted TIM-barrel fold metal-dependent hydrolase